jgi:DNA repair exonuclease SbcCD ATPase subunit
MKMTDEKLLEIFLEAADKKEIVFDLADANECGVWEMATHLKEIGADIKLNTFGKFNPKRGGQEGGGKIEYLKTIIKKQDEEIKRLASDKKTLEQSLQYNEEVISELRDQLKAATAPPERDEDTEQLLNEQRDKIEHLQQQVNEGVRKFNELYRQINEQEDINCFGMSDLINRFCGGLYGVNAYLTGRIVEMLYRWRFAGEDDQILLVPGLIDELANLIFDKTEETT